MLRASTEVDYPYFPFRIPVDFVLVNAVGDGDLNQHRRIVFEKAIRREGLIVQHETAGQLHFTLISAPFHRLCREAERLQIPFPLKDCLVTPGTPSCCFSLSKVFVTDDDVHFIHAPFQRKNGLLYLNYTNEKKFFTCAQRCHLTHQILAQIDISKEIDENEATRKIFESKSSTMTIINDEPLSRKGLHYLLMQEAYTEAFVLHSPSEEEPYFKKMKENSFVNFMELVSEIENDQRKRLSESWCKWYKFQPLNQIRDYFGEQIAFYFAWQGTFVTLLWPATLFGLFVFIYGFVDSVKTNPANFGNCTKLTYQGDEKIVPCQFKTSATQFFSMIASWFMNSFDTKMNAYFAVVMSIWGSVFVQVWRRNNSVLTYKWNCEDFHAVEPDRPEFHGSRVKEDPITGEDIWISPAFARYLRMLASCCFVLFSMLLVVVSVFVVTIFKMWAVYHYECSSEYTLQCWLVAAFLPSTLNTLSTMGLGNLYSIIVAKLNVWENHRTHTEHNNALIMKIFAFQLVNTYTSLFYVAFFRPESHGFQENGLFGLGVEYRDTCKDETCSSLLALQLITHMLMKPVPKFLIDVVIPYFLKLFRVHRWASQREATLKDILKESDETNLLVREWMKPSAGDFVLWEMNEKIILFGTTVMFASLFPLAPLLALIIGLIDLRIDAHRLTWFNRKPVAVVNDGIGIWLPILSFLQYSAVITNAFIVAFTSDFCSKFFNDVMYCNVQNRLIIVIVFQNLVFILKYALQSFIPTVPSAISVAQRKRRYVIGHILEKGDVPTKIRNKKKTRFAKLAWITSNQRRTKRLTGKLNIERFKNQVEAFEPLNQSNQIINV